MHRSHAIPRALPVLLLALLMALAAAALAVRPAAAAHVAPVFVPGNPTCSGLGYGDFEFKVEPVTSGLKGPDANGFMVDITVNNTALGQTFDWSSNFNVNAVVAKGGPNANLYVYDPAETSDTGLHAPLGAGPGGSRYFGLSHISFCYSLNLVVTKDADTSFTRTWTWDIDKSADQTDLGTIQEGDLVQVNYDVEVSAVSADSDWAVSGSISIHNPAGIAATVTNVTDEITGGIAATVVCPDPFPFSVPAGGTVVCTYSADLPDASTRTNTATVTTSGAVGGGSGQATVDFAGATMTEIDDCVDVSDTNVGFLGTVCANADPFSHTFSYSLWFGAHPDADVVLECGENTHPNVASFITNDTGTTGEDDWTVIADVECAEDEGCTPGFWRQPQHFQFWTGYATTDVYSAVFGVGPSISLLDAVNTGGGGENALLRHSTAALLNAANPNVNYAYTEAQVIAMVQAAYASGDFTGTASLFAAANEAGCPF